MFIFRTGGVGIEPGSPRWQTGRLPLGQRRTLETPWKPPEKGGRQETRSRDGRLVNLPGLEQEAESLDRRGSGLPAQRDEAESVGEGRVGWLGNRREAESRDETGRDRAGNPE